MYIYTGTYTHICTYEYTRLPQQKFANDAGHKDAPQIHEHLYIYMTIYMCVYIYIHIRIRTYEYI